MAEEVLPDSWTALEEAFGAVVKMLEPKQAIKALAPTLAEYREFVNICRATILRLAGEKEDMKMRNRLLRHRLDQYPEQAKPRLDILDRLDRAEARVKELEALLQQPTPNREAETHGTVHEG